jgi:hypothetical protein
MDFPALTICNLNSNRLSKLTVDDIYHIGFINGLISKNRTYSPFLQKNTGKMLSDTLKNKISKVVSGYQRKRIINKVIIIQLAVLFWISTVVSFYLHFLSNGIFAIEIIPILKPAKKSFCSIRHV